MTDKFEHAKHNAQGWFEEIQGMLDAFQRAEADNDLAAQDDARQTIEESVLSVLVRDGWHAPGQLSDDGAEEYEILLSTGGPALRIYGRLGRYGEPTTAELQMQDWSLPWTRYEVSDEDILLRFVSFFYFGE
jgi:hypothetical protein